MYANTIAHKVSEERTSRRMTMKTILSVLLALSVFAGLAAPAGAYPAYNRNGDRDAGLSSPL
jgi:hypothetical protein